MGRGRHGLPGGRLPQALLALCSRQAAGFQRALAQLPSPFLERYREGCNAAWPRRSARLAAFAERRARGRPRPASQRRSSRTSIVQSGRRRSYAAPVADLHGKSPKAIIEKRLPRTGTAFWPSRWAWLTQRCCSPRELRGARHSHHGRGRFPLAGSTDVALSAELRRCVGA